MMVQSRGRGEGVNLPCNTLRSCLSFVLFPRFCLLFTVYGVYISLGWILVLTTGSRRYYSEVFF
jgi:hypothetical protein